MGVKVKKHKGRWYVFIHHHGRRKAKKVGTRQAAERVRRELEARIALGAFDLRHENNHTFAEYAVGKDYVWDIKAFAAREGKTIDEAKKAFKQQKAQGWVKHYAEQKLKPSTADFYLEYLDRYVLPRFGAARLDEIARKSVKNWIADLATRSLSRNTIRLCVSSLRAVLNGAIEDGLLQANPAARLGRFVKSEKPGREASSLTADEVTRLLEAAKKSCPHYYPLFLTAVRAGLREGELTAVQWGDIQFGESAEDPNRYILVRRNYDWRSRKVLTPKNRKPRRVDLGRDLRQVLMDLRDQRLLQAYGRGQATISDDLVFRTVAGTQLDIRGNVVQRYFLPALEAAGLRRIRFHDLRHTFGSLLIQARAPLTYVRDQMGHSSIKITVDIYGHLIPSADIRFMDAVGAAKSEPTPETSRAKNATPAQPNEEPIGGNLVQVLQNDGVGDGIRTRDVQIHSLALYQLSYTHHSEAGWPLAILLL